MLIEQNREITTPIQAPINDLIAAWKEFFSHTDWQELIKDYKAIEGGCGTIYEIGNPLKRENEDCAIVDMRNIAYSEPHYHPTNCYEAYIILQGSALVIVGHKQLQVQKGDTLFIPPKTAHFTIPDDQCVLAAINLPPYSSENYIPLTASNKDVLFDYDLFERMTQ